ncbi:MAG TPA: hypothetical protein VIM62_12775 [Acidobacteriaceae bacterium]
MKKWTLAIALAVGTLGLGATQANAARIGFGLYVGAPAYQPPCPGPGYEWVAGYYNNGYWVPGFWRAPEPRVGVIVGRGYGWHAPVYDHRFDDHRVYRGGFRR